MTAENKVLLIVVVTFTVSMATGLRIGYISKKCKPEPCQLDSLVSQINIRDSINLTLQVRIKDLTLGKAISDNNHANQIYLLRNEIHALTDSTRLLFFKDFATGNNIRTSAVRFSNK